MAGNGDCTRVLVVEDNEAMRTVIRRMLTNHGYQVDAASTLAEARSMDPRGYGAVIVDANLGADRGAELIEKLRAEDPAAARRCLLITGGPGTALPADIPHLAKPFQASQLLAAVTELSQGTAPPAAGHPQPLPPSPVSTAEAAAPRRAAPQQDPASDAGSVWQLLALIRRRRDRESVALADFIHAGPVQELAAATLALHIMRKPTAPGPAGSLDEVVRELNAAARALRWLVDHHWQPASLPADLATVMRHQPALLVGEPLSLDVQQAEGIDAAELAAIADVAELMLLAAVPPGMSARARATVATTGHEIKIRLTIEHPANDGEEAIDPAAAQAALKDLGRALGTQVHAEFGSLEWRTWLAIPRHAAGFSPKISDIPPKIA